MKDSLVYRPAAAEVFLDHYRTGLYTTTELCQIADITVEVFYHWKKNNEEFQGRLAEADKDKHTNINVIAIKSAVKLMQGYSYEEETEEWKQPKKVRYSFLDEDDDLNDVIKPPLELVKKTVVKKQKAPNAAIVQFVLRNLDKDNFPDTVDKNALPGATMVPVYVLPPANLKYDFPADTTSPDE